MAHSFLDALVIIESLISIIEVLISLFLLRPSNIEFCLNCFLVCPSLRHYCLTSFHVSPSFISTVLTFSKVFMSSLENSFVISEVSLSTFKLFTNSTACQFFISSLLCKVFTIPNLLLIVIKAMECVTLSHTINYFICNPTTLTFHYTNGMSIVF